MGQSRFDIHNHITQSIIAAIESGPGEFRLPWHRSSGNIVRPKNALTKNAYRGVNIVALWAQADLAGFQSGLWGTFKQWNELGASVRKGSKAAYVVFYKEIEIDSADASSDSEPETRLFAKATPVFAAEQVEGFELPAPPLPAQIDPVARLQAVEAFVAASGADIAHGGSRAFYSPSQDTIQMPLREAFIGSPTSTPTEAYYATLLHELTHWTAPKTRCDRELGKRFGDQAYAAEELVAELGAAFLCAELGVTNEARPDHAQYLASWLELMKSDTRAIFTAASQASRAVQFLETLQPPPA
jgi:antirestriction protein ArdC